MDFRIRELLLAPMERHDLSWLRSSLQTVITVEFSTLPLYLAAHWSVDPSEGGDPDNAAGTIRSILLDEMVHMGLLCNMLAGLGGTPIVNRPGFVPVYPAHLLGGVHPGLKVSLRRLTPASLDAFMGIENPSHRPIGLERIYSDPRHTIGEFYEAIEQAVERLAPEWSDERQIAAHQVGLFKITSLDDARRAILLIQRQGEGFRHSPVADPLTNTLAHYYQFGELHHGARLRKDEVTGEWAYDGALLRFPKVRPMADIPPGGYQQGEVAPEVWDLLHQFDHVFTDLLNHLQRTWETGDANEIVLGHASMSRLEALAVRLMETPIPGGRGNYGPCFRLIAEGKASFFDSFGG
jgi:hypothetical protein